MTIAALLHPQLPQLPAPERRAAMREAQRAPFDILELVGMAAGLIAAGIFLDSGEAERLALGAGVAVLTVAGFTLRRTRRGLRRILGGA